MPREGYKSITVSEKVKERLDKIAEKNGISIPEVIVSLLATCKEA